MIQGERVLTKRSEGRVLEIPLNSYSSRINRFITDPAIQIIITTRINDFFSNILIKKG